MMEQIKCIAGLRPHKTKGFEIVLSGNCADTVKVIMQNLGPYGQKYVARRLVYEDSATERKTDGDTTSN